MFLDRISPKTCLKMDYFGSKSPPNRQAMGAPTPDPLATGGWELPPQTHVRVK